MKRGVRCASVIGVLLLGGGGQPVFAAASTPAASHVNSDEQLGLSVDLLLRNDRYLDYRDVRADAKNGEVVLTGAVLTDFEKAHAAQVAGGEPGVTRVKNDILVVRDAAGDESDLARRVRDVLSRHPTVQVTALAIETEAKDDVILHGIVFSAELKARIGQLASTVPGVRQVDNDLDVEPAG